MVLSKYTDAKMYYVTEAYEYRREMEKKRKKQLDKK